MKTYAISVNEIEQPMFRTYGDTNPLGGRIRSQYIPGFHFDSQDQLPTTLQY